MQAPCKDCKDRRVTDDYNCHAVCEKYKAYQAANEARLRSADLDRRLSGYRADQVRKAKSKIRKFRKDYRPQD